MAPLNNSCWKKRKFLLIITLLTPRIVLSFIYTLNKKKNIIQTSKDVIQIIFDIKLTVIKYKEAHTAYRVILEMAMVNK